MGGGGGDGGGGEGGGRRPLPIAFNTIPAKSLNPRRRGGGGTCNEIQTHNIIMSLRYGNYKFTAKFLICENTQTIELAELRKSNYYNCQNNLLQVTYSKEKYLTDLDLG